MEAADEIALYLLVEQQPGAYRKLVSEFRSAALALAATARAWRALGIKQRQCDARAAWPQGTACEDIRHQWRKSLSWLEGEHRGVWLDSECNQLSEGAWPRAFAEVPKRPPLLFWQGDETVMGLPQIAVVGSRAATRTGLATAHTIAAELAQTGMVVTSGLASGIDGAAHAGALSVQGKTLAVLGCGLDRVYPARHKQLAERITESGLMVSEFTPGSVPEPWCFPRRNEVIALLSMGVAVIEAGPVSGSIITAQAANQLSRCVWAVPGPISSLQSRGCHRLIRDEQARLVESAQDILQDALPVLRDWYGHAPEQVKPRALLGRVKPPAPSSFGQQILAAMEWQVMTVDSLMAESAQPADHVLMALGELEMLGWIAAVPGGYQRLAS